MDLSLSTLFGCVVHGYSLINIAFWALSFYLFLGVPMAQKDFIFKSLRHSPGPYKIIKEKTILGLGLKINSYFLYLCNPGSNKNKEGK